jgi:hypothetical protein
LLLRYQIAVSRVPLYVSETKCHLWTNHPDAFNTIGDGVTVGVDVRRNVGLEVGLGVDVSGGLAAGSGDDVAVIVVVGVRVGLDVAVVGST